MIFGLYRTYAEKINAEDSTTTEKDTIVAEESKDDKTIIKQINKQNEDGTYTFGYEADDGTFKYESRDVLGNVKRTFGYVDTDGLIKRVTYTTNENNETSSESLEDDISTTKPNVTQYLSSTTRRPYLQISTSRSNVIQSIPRRKADLTTQSSSSSSSTQSPQVVYATSIPSSSTSRIVMPPSPHTRPILQNGVFIRSTSPPQNHENHEGQIVRPSIQTESSSTIKPVRRVLVSRQPVSHDKTSTTESQTSSTLRPNLETDQFLENESSSSTTTTHKSNTFRRQLTPEKGYDPHQHILNYQQSAGDDTTDIYGGSVMTGTQRPLFTTTQNSRIIQNSGRHAIIRNGHYLPIGYHRNTNAKYRQDPLVEAPTTQPTIEEPYQTQTTVPVISIPEYAKKNHRYPQYTRPTLNTVVKNHNHNYLREEEPEALDPQTSYVAATQENEQYLRENPLQNGPVQFPENPAPQPVHRTRKSRPLPAHLAQYQGEYPDPNYQSPVHIPIPIPQPNYRGAFGNEIAQGAPEDIQPPVTNKDFQRLLNQLIYLQTKLQQLTQIAQYQQEIINQQRQSQPNPYYQPGIPIIPRNSYSRPYERPPFYPTRQRYLPPGYQQEQSDYIDPAAQYDPRYQRKVAVPQQQYENQQDYLPPEVREMLLLRMLQLAINSEIAATNQMEVIAKSPTKNVVSVVRKDYQNRHPIHNVQILGEETNNNERLKPTARSKRFKDPDEDMDYYE
ncbi:uncharacterized protein LOC123305430 [Chrysoperla carnea]|uniref:uncharacterized protein LOC123305430 n=1 Tax=Chrysoperla carnea TaxID=189513 RepID=UPI001D08CDFC|nr:uncharacterized protein LOC123305430 [Chrysoperla carnea]